MMKKLNTNKIDGFVVIGFRVAVACVCLATFFSCQTSRSFSMECNGQAMPGQKLYKLELSNDTLKLKATRVPGMDRNESYVCTVGKKEQKTIWKQLETLNFEDAMGKRQGMDGGLTYKLTYFKGQELKQKTLIGFISKADKTFIEFLENDIISQNDWIKNE